MISREITVVIPTCNPKYVPDTDLLACIVEPDYSRSGTWVTFNRAAKKVRTKWALFMHDDIILAKGDWNKLAAHTEAADIINGGVFVERKGVQPFYSLNLAVLDTLDPTVLMIDCLAQRPKCRQVKYVGFWLTLINMEKWATLAGFSSDYTHHFADFDFCIRAAEKNIRIGFCTETMSVHKEGTDRMCVERVKDLSTFKRKWPNLPYDISLKEAQASNCENLSVEYPPLESIGSR